VGGFLMLERKNKINDKEEDMVEEVVEDFTMVEIPEQEEASEALETEEADKMPASASKESIKPGFFSALLAAASDIIVIGVLTYGLLYLADFILRIAAGFYIVDKIQMLAFLFLVVSILYFSILESTIGASVGKKIVNLKVVRE
jgi:hypothetical protein